MLIGLTLLHFHLVVPRGRITVLLKFSTWMSKMVGSRRNGVASTALTTIFSCIAISTKKNEKSKGRLIQNQL